MSSSDIVLTVCSVLLGGAMWAFVLRKALGDNVAKRLLAVERAQENFAYISTKQYQLQTEAIEALSKHASMASDQLVQHDKEITLVAAHGGMLERTLAAYLKSTKYGTKALN